MDIGWTELLVIGIVALVVVGPKDLPIMFKTFGRFMARARAMARDFQRAMEQAADDSGVKDMADDLKKAASPMSSGIDTLKNAATKFEQWDPARPVRSAAKAAAGAAMATPAETAAASAAAPVTAPDPATTDPAPAAAPTVNDAPSKAE